VCSARPDARPPRPAEPTPRLRLAIATGLGAGYAPVAPGTFGSALGLLLHVAVALPLGSAAAAVAAAVAIAAGFSCAGTAERHFGGRDPGRVVIDEVAGQMLALAFLPVTPGVLAAGFVLFRILDVLKPFPARRLEDLPGGSGIMADDLAAAAYANLLLQISIRVFPGWLGAS